MSAPVNNLILSARRGGYSEAVSDLYVLLKKRKGSDTLTWEDMDLVTAMMQNEVTKFMPNNANEYDNLPTTISKINQL